MKKRLLALFLTTALALSLTACAPQTATPSPTAPVTPPASTAPVKAEPQTATATMKGYGGDITVTLTVEGNKITDVKAEGPGESLTIGSVAVEQLPARILEQNTTEIDGVSGATITSAVLLSAARDALKQLGLTAADLAPGTEPAPIDAAPVTADVVVIGGGGAGVTAAMAAREAGKSVVVLEKLGILGGNTAMSGGVMVRAKIDGDPDDTMTEDQLYDYYRNLSHEGNDPEVVRTYVDRCTDTLSWIHAMGPGVGETGRYRTNPENIMALQPAKGSGRALMAPMIEGLEASGTQIFTETTASELIMKDGRVAGVKATRADGQVQEFYANGGVVLACGGFPASPELLAKYSSLGAEKATPLCSKGTTGDGIVMAEAVGADVKFGADWDSIGSNSELTGPYMAAFPQLNALLVNSKGERFITEDEQRPQLYKEMLRQIATGVDGFYFVFDSKTIGEGADAFVEKKAAFKADTLEELADLMGVPKEAFLAAAKRYNDLAGQDDPDFKKPAKFMLGLGEGPFYAAKTWAIRTSTIGGLVTDAQARVLDAAGQPVPGLFAGGEVSNYSFFYNEYPTCGSAVGHAMVFGRIAGENAAAEVK